MGDGSRRRHGRDVNIWTTRPGTGSNAAKNSRRARTVDARRYEPPPFVSADAFAAASAGDDLGGDDSDDASTADVAARDDAAARPPWRWILLGCPRSGTGVHVDPLMTHAWVHLLEGTKRWIFIRPETPPELLESVGLGGPRLPSANWFDRFHEAVVRWPGDYVVEHVQRPGELVYVPAGWHHAVLNLSWTYAVTENYAVLSDACVAATRTEEPEFFARLRATLPSRAALATRSIHARVASFAGVPESPSWLL